MVQKGTLWEYLLYLEEVASEQTTKERRSISPCPTALYLQVGEALCSCTISFEVAGFYEAIPYIQGLGAG